jgi:hypothetical protein
MLRGDAPHLEVHADGIEDRQVAGTLVGTASGEALANPLCLQWPPHMTRSAHSRYSTRDVSSPALLAPPWRQCRLQASHDLLAAGSSMASLLCVPAPVPCFPLTMTQGWRPDFVGLIPRRELPHLQRNMCAAFSPRRPGNASLWAPGSDSPWQFVKSAFPSDLWRTIVRGVVPCLCY